RGVQVSGRHDFTARVTAAADPNELPEFDVGIIATKASGVEDAAASLAGRFPAATIMTVQNGLGAEEIVHRHGEWPLISAVTFMSGTKHSDTHVEYVLDTPTWLGPYGATPFERVEELARHLVESGLEAEALPDLRPAQWSKLIFNATVNGVAALTGLPHDAHFAAEGAESDLGHLVHALVDEGKRIAVAGGVVLHDDPWEMNVLATKRGSAHYPSMLEDVEAVASCGCDRGGGCRVCRRVCRDRPERPGERGSDCKTRRAGDSGHDLSCRQAGRAGPRPVGRQGRHDTRAIRAPPGSVRGG